MDARRRRPPSLDPRSRRPSITLHTTHYTLLHASIGSCSHAHLPFQNNGLSDCSYQKMIKVLTVGDGDLTLSLALARAYGNHIELTASVLDDSKETLLQAFPDAPFQELEEVLKIQILYGLDATQLHKLTQDKWDLVLFHHPHLGLASLETDEVFHATRHYRLLCHYLSSAGQVSNLVHVCLCGTQPDTWKLMGAAQEQGMTLLRKFSTTLPFSNIWSEDNVEPQTVKPHFAAPRRYRNGKLGSRHFLGKYGYRHRRTEGERYKGLSSDTNVSGSVHFVFQPSSKAPSPPRESKFPAHTCTICRATFSTNPDLSAHLLAPALPQVGLTTVCKSNGPKQDTSKDDTKSRQAYQGQTSQMLASDCQRIRELLVSDKCDGKRLRWYIQHSMNNFSKRKAECSITEGLVLVNGEHALDSGRILRAGDAVQVYSKKETKSLNPTLEIVHRRPPFLVVWKPSGMRTKGGFPSTLEWALVEQEGVSCTSLSKLDTFCPGLCVVLTRSDKNDKKPQSSPYKIRHFMTALVHGRLPDEWSPCRDASMTMKQKWNKRKHPGDTMDTEQQQETETIQLIPMERQTSLSTLYIETKSASASSICQFLRQEGFPVVSSSRCDATVDLIHRRLNIV